MSTGGGGGGGEGAGTFLMEHMVTFLKFQFYHPPTPSANEITKKYQGTFQLVKAQKIMSAVR